MGRFEDRVAVVTGAAAGIGEAVADAFLAEGAAVVGVDRSHGGAHGRGERYAAVAGDVRRAETAEEAASVAIERFGRLDILVNCAGIVIYGEVPDYDEADWDTVLEVNLKGPFLMARSTIPHMRQVGGGAIVNLASIQATMSQPSVSAYAASKGGLLSLTRVLSLDHAKDNIRVNAISPGSVLTPMLRYGAEIFAPEDPEAGLEAWGRSHPIGRVTMPHEVASLVLFLCSSEAPTITGGNYSIDGGVSAKAGV